MDMKIIAGTLGGRLFDSPKGNRTHPMSDKVRGALFNTLGNIEGATVLDAFAGTGALSFEAISRGAIKAIAIDSDKRAFFTIQENIKKLQLEEVCKATRANVSSWSNNNENSTFSLVIVDPPYNFPSPSIVKKLTKHVAPNGRFVLSWPGKDEPLALNGFTVVRQKKYGDAQIIIYKSASNDASSQASATV